MYVRQITDILGIPAVSRGWSFQLLASAKRLVDDPPAPATRRPGWLERVDLWFSRARQRDIESYLAQSRDVFELERRIHELERARPAWPG